MTEVTEAFAKALVKFQTDLPAVSLDGDNPHFKSKFTTLANLTNVVLPKLTEHGFSFSATPQVTENGFVLEAHLIHESGERLSASFPITDTNPQKVGSAVTYYRRYALAALTGVVAETDDDGNAASNPSADERRIAAVQTVTQPKPAASGGGELAKLNEVIRGYIAGDDARRDDVNARIDTLKGTGSATDIRKKVISDLGIK